MNYLDNNYRKVGDRYITERDYLIGSGGAALLELLPLHPLLRWLVGVSSAIAAVVLATQANTGPWTELGVLLGILAALVAGFLGLVFAPFVLYGGAGVLVYRNTSSITLAIFVPIICAYVGYKWGSIVRTKQEAQSDASSPWVLRSVQILALVFLSAILISLTLTIALDDRKQESTSPTRSTTVVMPTESRVAVLPKMSGIATAPNRVAEPVVRLDTAIPRNGLAQASIAELEVATNNGDVGAETELGVRYLTGGGVQRDYSSAIRRFRAAASKGDLRAITNLGWMFTLGQGVARDDSKALDLFKQAASEGYANAQDSVGYMHEHGRGVPVDSDIAASWYRKAADQGFQKSIANLQRLSSQ